MRIVEHEIHGKEADCWFFTTDRKGKQQKHHALLIREWVSGYEYSDDNGRVRSGQVILGDLVVDFGTFVEKLQANGDRKKVPEWKTINGVAKRGQQVGGRNFNRWAPKGASKDEVAEWEIAEADREKIEAEVKELRSLAEQEKSAAEKAKARADQVAEFAAMSDKDLFTHAKSLGANVKASASRADVIAAILEAE